MVELTVDQLSDAHHRVQERAASMVRALELEPFAEELLNCMLSAWRLQTVRRIAAGECGTVDEAREAVLPLSALPPSEAVSAARQRIRSALLHVATARIDEWVHRGPRRQLHHSTRALFSNVDVPEWFFSGFEAPELPSAERLHGEPIWIIRFGLSPSVARQLLGMPDQEWVMPPDAIRGQLPPTAAALYDLVRDHPAWQPDEITGEFLDLDLTPETWNSLGIRAAREGNRRRTLRRAVQVLGRTASEYATEAETLTIDGQDHLRLRRSI